VIITVDRSAPLHDHEDDSTQSAASDSNVSEP
jgi:hypothetical protein